MALWFFILLPLFALGESRTTNPINQTNLQAAMCDMRTWSYHGFVILLKILKSSSHCLQNREMTFFLPNDQELSKMALRVDNLQEFILSHSIPTALLLSDLFHFPNGSLVPSSLPNKMLSITHSGRSGLLVNNARIVNPDVCLNTQIRCHGISTAIKFDTVHSSLETQHLNLPIPNQGSMDSANTHMKEKSSFNHMKMNLAPP